MTLAEAQSVALVSAGLEPVDLAPIDEPYLVYSDRTWFTPQLLRRMCEAGQGRLRLQHEGWWAWTGSLQDTPEPGMYELGIRTGPPGFADMAPLDLDLPLVLFPLVHLLPSPPLLLLRRQCTSRVLVVAPLLLRPVPPPPEQTTEAQTAYFLENGFVKIEGLLNAEQVGTMQQAFRREQLVSRAAWEEQQDFSEKQRGVSDSFRAGAFFDVGCDIAKDPVYLEILRSERLVPVLQALLGNDVHCVGGIGGRVVPAGARGGAERRGWCASREVPVDVRWV